MLAKRIIGVVLVEDGNVVRRVRGKTSAIIGRPEITVQYLQDWNVDELIFINLTGSDFDGTKKLLELATGNCFIPLAIAGNIDTKEKAKWCINNGVEKVVIGKHYSEKLCRDIADICGKQAITVSVDWNHKRALEIQNYCGEIILHDTTRDGTGEGLNLFKDIELEVPKVLMGGVGNYKHIAEGLSVADAVAVGNLFHFKELSATMAKNEAKKEGLLIR